MIPRCLALLALLAGGPLKVDGQRFTVQINDPAFPKAQGPRVLWDAAHFNAHLWGDMDAFADVLTKDGFRIAFQRERWTRSPLDSADLVVVAGPLAVDGEVLIAKGAAGDPSRRFEHYWWSDEGRQNAFTSQEVAALVTWVRTGGSLLLILDHAPSADAARLLSEAMGVEVRNSMTWDDGRRPPGYTYTDNRRASHILFSREYASLGDHPILKGRKLSERVDRVATYAGSSVVGPLGSSPLLLLSAESFDYWKNPPERGGDEHRVSAAGRAQAVAFHLGAGRVVVVTEFTPFQARWGVAGDPDGKLGAGMAYAGAQDQQFVTNIARWLAKVIP